MRQQVWNDYRLSLMLSCIKVDGCEKAHASGICCEEHYYTSCLNKISIEMPSVLDAFSFGKEWVLFAQGECFKKVLDDHKIPHKSIEWGNLMKYTMNEVTDALFNPQGQAQYFSSSKLFRLGISDCQLKLFINGPLDEVLPQY